MIFWTGGQSDTKKQNKRGPLFVIYCLNKIKLPHLTPAKQARGVFSEALKLSSVSSNDQLKLFEKVVLDNPVLGSGW